MKSILRFRLFFWNEPEDVIFVDSNLKGVVVNFHFSMSTLKHLWRDKVGVTCKDIEYVADEILAPLFFVSHNIGILEWQIVILWLERLSHPSTCCRS